MTDLISRPRPRAESSDRPPERALAMTAGFAGAVTAAAGLLVCMAVAVLGWFLADAGAHGSTNDALRVGADAWLMGQGAHLTLNGVTYGVVPLGLTMLLAWVALRGGAWAGRTAPSEDDRELGVGVGCFAGAYVVVAVVAAVLSGTNTASVSLVMAAVGPLVVAAVFGGIGLVRGAGQLDRLIGRLPKWLPPVARAAGSIVLGVYAAGAMLFAVSLALHFNSAATMMSRLGVSSTDAMVLLVASLLVLPNAFALGGSYLLGPGFAVGVGTAVSPTGVVLGPLPAFPLLAALPDPGPVSWWTTALIGLPSIVAAVLVARELHRRPVLLWDLAALRGVSAGIAAGVIAAAVGALGGGALGDGRMADFGASFAELLIAGCLSFGLGGLVGALAMTWWQRRTGVTLEEEVAAAEVDSEDTDIVELHPEWADTEDTVPIPPLGPDTLDR